MKDMDGLWAEGKVAMYVAIGGNREWIPSSFLTFMITFS